jgi:hypothetical protein
MSLEQFIKNRNAFPAAELDRYTGQHVAWSPDGSRILVGDPDPLKVVAAVKAMGYDPAETPIEDIPSEDGFPGHSLGASLGRRAARTAFPRRAWERDNPVSLAQSPSLQYFHAELLGADLEVLLIPNRSFHGIRS